MKLFPDRPYHKLTEQILTSFTLLSNSTFNCIVYLRKSLQLQASCHPIKNLDISRYR